MGKVPSVGFSLDATAPVPNRTLPRQAKTQERLPSQPQQPSHSAPEPPPARSNVPLAEHLEAQSPELRLVLLALAAGFKEVGGRLRYGLRMPSGLDASVDAHRVEAAGDVGRLDRAVGHFLVEALSKTGVCCTIALETHEGLVEVPCGPADGAEGAGSGARLAVVIDPLDGVNNADAGVSIGTIFGVYRVDGAMQDDARQRALVDDVRVAREGDASLPHVLRRGEELVAAGYAMFGVATQMVLSCGQGVDGFTLQPELQRFMLTRPQLQMPLRGRVVSVNLGHAKDWDPAVAEHVTQLTEARTLRYIGTLVADLHRTLLYGGIFLYPSSRKMPRGKLKLLFEAAPMAYLMEQAGGGASDGTVRLLSLTPTTLSQCTSACFGSLHDVNGYIAACGGTPPPHRVGSDGTISRAYASTPDEPSPGDLVTSMIGRANFVTDEPSVTGSMDGLRVSGDTSPDPVGGKSGADASASCGSLASCLSSRSRSPRSPRSPCEMSSEACKFCDACPCVDGCPSRGGDN